jgi:hypothetical protein
MFALPCVDGGHHEASLLRRILLLIWALDTHESVLVFGLNHRLLFLGGFPF